MTGDASEGSIPSWMRETPIHRKLKSSSRFAISARMRGALVAIIIAVNVCALGMVPVAASVVLLMSGVVFALIVLRVPGEMRVLHKAAVMGASVAALYLMLTYVPPAFEGIEASSATGGIPPETGYFASAALAIGLAFMAFWAREPRRVPNIWRVATMIAVGLIDLYVWTSPYRIEFLEPLAFAAIWPMALFTVLIPFSTFAYHRNYISVPSDAWQ